MAIQSGSPHPTGTGSSWRAELEEKSRAAIAKCNETIAQIQRQVDQHKRQWQCLQQQLTTYQGVPVEPRLFIFLLLNFTICSFLSGHIQAQLKFYCPPKTPQPSTSLPLTASSVGENSFPLLREAFPSKDGTEWCVVGLSPWRAMCLSP